MMERIFPFVLTAIMLAMFARLAWRMFVLKELKTRRERWLFTAFLVICLLGLVFDPFPKAR